MYKLWIELHEDAWKMFDIDFKNFKRKNDCSVIVMHEIHAIELNIEMSIHKNECIQNQLKIEGRVWHNSGEAEMK